VRSPYGPQSYVARSAHWDDARVDHPIVSLIIALLDVHRSEAWSPPTLWWHLCVFPKRNNGYKPERSTVCSTRWWCLCVFSSCVFSFSTQWWLCGSAKRGLSTLGWCCRVVSRGPAAQGWWPAPCESKSKTRNLTTRWWLSDAAMHGLPRSEVTFSLTLTARWQLRLLTCLASPTMWHGRLLSHEASWPRRAWPKLRGRGRILLYKVFNSRSIAASLLKLWSKVLTVLK
jgi:hypothetical protein